MLGASAAQGDKLTLQEPNNLDYRNFADRLLEIYRAACRVQRDGRFSHAGRTQRVADLDDMILELCGPLWVAELPPLEGPDNDYRLLANELMRLMLARELFLFVTAQPAKQPNGETPLLGATNNEAERTLRNPAQARKTGRTNKTIAGARRTCRSSACRACLRRSVAGSTRGEAASRPS